MSKKRHVFTIDQIDELIREPKLLAVVRNFLPTQTTEFSMEMGKAQLKQLSLMFKELPPELDFDASTGDVIQRVNGKKVAYDLVTRK